jgi:hypothetical protein
MVIGTDRKRQQRCGDRHAGEEKERDDQGQAGQKLGPGWGGVEAIPPERDRRGWERAGGEGDAEKGSWRVNGKAGAKAEDEGDDDQQGK